ncbi:4a-hydroxytetrahydrobiopterin dehydratase [Candidatus Nanosalina sp. VS9-1]|uniref:4a-hydroxytetrahydrobiopterin dehydratase n=1 Tax=Candidatus Nanosalina sp. VS9-1 TaxID=3388566 RepID=UPI0039E0A71A
MTHLADKICKVASEGEGLKGNDVPHYRAQLHSDWDVREEALTRKFSFRDFSEAVEFAQDLTDLVDSQGHHPEVNLSYGEASLKFSTEEVEGLHENDFIMAAKIDRLHRKLEAQEKASN